MIEETKGVAVDIEKEDDNEEEFVYPEECKVLDIMREKYHDAIQFMYDTEDKKQLGIAVKEYQRFSYFYTKMSRYLEFDPQEIEDEIY